MKCLLEKWCTYSTTIESIVLLLQKNFKDDSLPNEVNEDSSANAFNKCMVFTQWKNPSLQNQDIHFQSSLLRNFITLTHNFFVLLMSCIPIKFEFKQLLSEFPTPSLTTNAQKLHFNDSVTNLFKIEDTRKGFWGPQKRSDPRCLTMMPDEHNYLRLWSDVEKYKWKQRTSNLTF